VAPTTDTMAILGRALQRRAQRRRGAGRLDHDVGPARPSIPRRAPARLGSTATAPSLGERPAPDAVHADNARPRRRRHGHQPDRA
jgi:hypothetical protein